MPSQQLPVRSQKKETPEHVTYVQNIFNFEHFP